MNSPNSGSLLWALACLSPSTRLLQYITVQLTHKIWASDYCTTKHVANSGLKHASLFSDRTLIIRSKSKFKVPIWPKKGAMSPACHAVSSIVAEAKCCSCGAPGPALMAVFCDFDVVHINLTSLYRRPSMSSWMRNFWKHWQEWLAIYDANRILVRKWIVPSLHTRKLTRSQWEKLCNSWKQNMWSCCYTSLQRNQPVQNWQNGG